MDHHAVSLTTRSRPHSFKLRSYHAPHAPRVRYYRRWWCPARRPIRSRLTRRSDVTARVTRAPIGRCPLTMLTAPSSAPTTPLPAARRVCFENSLPREFRREYCKTNRWKLFSLPVPSFPHFTSRFYFEHVHLEITPWTLSFCFSNYAQQRASSTCRKKFNIWYLNWLYSRNESGIETLLRFNTQCFSTCLWYIF